MRVETFILGELMEKGYLVIDDEKSAAVIIDPGDNPASLIDRLDEGGETLLGILLTHGHWDHVAGVHEIKAVFDAPVYLHEADVPLYRMVAEQAGLFGFQADPQPPEDHQPKDGDVITLGPFQFEVLHTPGHTPGGVCYKIGGIVFVGDTIFHGSIGRSDLPGGSGEQLLASIRQKILTLDDEVLLYPGHGPPTTVAVERASNPFLA